MFRRTLKKILLVVLEIASICLIVYPFISELVYSETKDSMILEYEGRLGAIENDSIDHMLEEAEKYNAELARSHIVLSDPFDSKENTFIKEEYETLLKANAGSGMMGYIDIPCIDVKLPVFHGTSEAVLKKGIGHLQGTSLPVGGSDTHAVLTGHTGLSSAKLFTDLEQMTEGDRFYLTISGKKLVYGVIKICVVTPEETEALGIVKGRDLCTLVTCTPYGINSHRLLVTGERITEKGENDAQVSADISSGEMPRDSQWMNAYKKAVMTGIVIIAVMGAAVKVYEASGRGKK